MGSTKIRSTGPVSTQSESGFNYLIILFHEFFVKNLNTRRKCTIKSYFSSMHKSINKFMLCFSAFLNSNFLKIHFCVLIIFESHITAFQNASTASESSAHFADNQSSFLVVSQVSMLFPFKEMECHY